MTSSQQWLEMENRIKRLIDDLRPIHSDLDLQATKIRSRIAELHDLAEHCKVEAKKAEEIEHERAHGSTLLEEQEEIERGN